MPTVDDHDALMGVARAELADLYGYTVNDTDLAALAAAAVKRAAKGARRAGRRAIDVLREVLAAERVRVEAERAKRARREAWDRAHPYRVTPTVTALAALVAATLPAGMRRVP